MVAPFDYSDVSGRAKRLEDELRKADGYRDDTWRDPTLGPMVRVHALLTHFPNEAFDGPVTREYVAECRMYASLFLAAIYDGLVGAKTFDDAFIDLLTEYDSLVDAKLVEAMESAKSDANRQLVELKKSGTRARVRKPGSIRRIRPGQDD